MPPQIHPYHATVGGALNPDGQLNEIPFFPLIDCSKRCLTNAQFRVQTFIYPTFALFSGQSTLAIFQKI